MDTLGGAGGDTNFPINGYHGTQTRHGEVQMRLRTRWCAVMLVALTTSSYGQTLTYRGTDVLAGYILTEPTNSGGDTFKFPMEFELTIEMELTPFQHVTFNELSITALNLPNVHEFPDFGGAVALTIDTLSFDWGYSVIKRDLNPAVGGVFETAPIDFKYGHVTSEVEWNNFSLQSSLSGLEEDGAEFRDYYRNEATLVVDPDDLGSPQVLNFNFRDDYNSENNLVEASTGHLKLEPHYEFDRVRIPFPSDTATGQWPDTDEVYSFQLFPVNAILQGDFDESGFVDIGDLNLVLFNWNEDSSSLPSNWTGQVPVSGTTVSVDHLNAVLFNWNSSLAGSLPAPEPGTIVLAMLAALSGCVHVNTCRRKRR